MEKMKKLGSVVIGDVVRITGNSSESINCIGDIGIVMELDLPAVRVYVPGRKYNGQENVCNWHVDKELLRYPGDLQISAV
jgi:hypothetical protein